MQRRPGSRAGAWNKGRSDPALHLEWRVLGGNAQPLAVRHHPRIGEPYPCVDRLASGVRSLAGEDARGNGRIAKHRDLEIRVIGAAPLLGFGRCEYGVLASE